MIEAFVDVPMFEIVAGSPQLTCQSFPGPRTVRRVACSGGAHRAGLVVGAGEHLVWRRHDVHTAVGGSWPCHVGGQCLCQAPARDVNGIHTPTCQDPTSSEWSYDL